MKKITFAKPIDKRKAVEIAHIIYAVLLIALAITVGILFIVNVVDVYNSSDFSPFTVEAIFLIPFRALSLKLLRLPSTKSTTTPRSFFTPKQESLPHLKKTTRSLIFSEESVQSDFLWQRTRASLSE